MPSSAPLTAEHHAADQLCINTIRTLAMDAVQKANSGHPGTPMALAPVGYTLWSQFLRYHPQHPDWPNRDRFVLSVGHASMLLYSLLHLAGVDEIDAHGKPTGKPAISLEDIKQFRQLDSKTPGHPEYRMTTGVETTTGPLGQGCANSVGMAMAERWLAERFNRPGATLFDYKVYTLCGDGDMMEGVSSEAASIAGHLKLANLCWIYDNNTISIEGHTELAFSEDVAERFRGYGWHTVHVKDANDAAALAEALQTFQSTTDAPTLIVVDSIIGYGAPHKQNTASAHGEPLGEDEIRLAKQSYGWDENSSFEVPEQARTRLRDALHSRSDNDYQAWNSTLEQLQGSEPALAAELAAMREGKMPAGWDAKLPTFDTDAKGIATRASGGKVLNAFAEQIPWLLGGSADLSPSTKTNLRRRRQFLGQGLQRPQPALRRARACHGRHRQRPGPVLPAQLHLDLPGVQRLHETPDPPGVDHGAARGVRVYPRLHRCGRRRADPPAYRAPDPIARHPRPADLAPGRRQ
jgi:transketolase